MGKIPVFTGACTALITPFNERGVDYEKLKQNIDRQFENGSAAIAVCSTTGESATLSESEQQEIVRVSVQANAGRMKVLVGIGSNNTLSALKRAEFARYAGADAVLMVTPYYNKSTQKGLVEHFSTVADRVDLPLILYNVPSRACVNIAPETYEILSRHPNINGVKEASGDIGLVGEIRSRCGDALNIWSGNDDNTVPIMALGGLGVISVAGNVVPAVVAKLCALCLAGDFKGATELYGKYAPFFSDLFIETNPIPVKAALKLLERDSGLLRLPLTDISDEHLATLRASMRALGLIG